MPWQVQSKPPLRQNRDNSSCDPTAISLEDPRMRKSVGSRGVIGFGQLFPVRIPWEPVRARRPDTVPPPNMVTRGAPHPLSNNYRLESSLLCPILKRGTFNRHNPPPTSQHRVGFGRTVNSDRGRIRSTSRVLSTLYPECFIGLLAKLTVSPVMPPALWF
jgi:hypothetical protein